MLGAGYGRRTATDVAANGVRRTAVCLPRNVPLTYDHDKAVNDSRAVDVVRRRWAAARRMITPLKASIEVD